MAESFFIIPPVKDPDALHFLQALLEVFTGRSVEQWWFPVLLQDDGRSGLLHHVVGCRGLSFGSFW